jgi:hypothetical protein
VPFLYDESRAPLVVVTSVGDTSDAEFDIYLEQMTALLARRTRYGVLLDARRSSRPPPKQRQKQADWMTKHASALRERNVCIAFVIDNAIVRGALTAILWLQPTPAPHKVFGDMDAAERWVLDLLRAEGLEVPKAPAARRA